MMARFCPKCGKGIKKGVFCKDCNPQPILEEIKEIKVRYCEECSRYFIKNSWKSYDEKDEPYKKTINALLKFKPSLEKKPKIDIELYRKGTKVKQAIVKAEINDNIEEQVIQIKTDKTMCRECSKKYSKYLEGTLQIRNVNPSTFEFLKNALDNAEKRFIHITRLNEYKDSIDIDMTNQKEIEKIARAMQKEFGGTLKIDYRLQTKDKNTQKDLYRITATLFLPTVLKGDIIEYDEEPYIVQSLDKKINAKNLLTQKRIQIEYEENYSKIKKHTTTVSIVKPQIQALDPENFQSEPLYNVNNKKLNSGKKIKVAKHNNKLFLIK